MLKRIIEILIFTSLIACSTQVVYKPIKEKIISKEITSKSQQKLRIDATLSDFNCDGMYDWYRATLSSVDRSGKWKLESTTGMPVKEIRSSVESYDGERRELCDRIAKQEVDGYIGSADSIETCKDFAMFDYTISFWDTTMNGYEDYEKSIVAHVDITGSVVRINAYFIQNPSEEVEMRMITNFFFPGETTTYTYKDLEMSINELITGNFMDVYFGAFVVRLVSAIEFYDINNKLVKSEDINLRQQFSVDVSNLPNDQYKVRIRRLDGGFWSDEGNNILIKR